MHDLEKVREDQWAREQDRLLLEKMRARREQGALHCPRCDAELKTDPGMSTSMICPSGHGAWLEGTALQQLKQAKR
jgi:uncharacterized C2H2 Zn-finger protein